MVAKKKKQIKTIADLQTDKKNTNQGTDRGTVLLDHSLRTFGAGRSILVAKDGGVIAGNKTLERATDLDMPIRVIETDGNELVVVQRTDLESDGREARELAIADNRCSEVGLEWNAEQLKADMEDGLNLEQFWGEDELKDLLGEADNNNQPKKDESYDEEWSILVDCKDEAEQLRLLERFAKEHIVCRPLIS